MFFQKHKLKIMVPLCVIILVFPFLIILHLYTHKIHSIPFENYIKTNSLVCIIYEAELNDTLLYIEGAVALPGLAENYTRENKYLYFINNVTEEIYVTRTGEIIIDNKLTDYINDGNDYSIGGFAAQLNLESLDIYNNSYSIYCCEQNFGINMIKDTFIDIDYGNLDFKRNHSYKE